MHVETYAHLHILGGLYGQALGDAWAKIYGLMELNGIPGTRLHAATVGLPALSTRSRIILSRMGCGRGR